MSDRIVCATTEMTYAEVANLLHQNMIGSIAICADGKLVGIVSEKDLFRAMFPNYGDYYRTPELFTDVESYEDAVSELRDKPIASFMITDVVTIRPDEPIMKAGGLMLAKHIHQLPVIENEKFVGMISREDVFSAILKARLGF